MQPKIHEPHLTLWNEGWSAYGISCHVKETQAATQGKLHRMRVQGVTMRRGTVAQSKLNKEHEIVVG